MQLIIHILFLMSVLQASVFALNTAEEYEVKAAYLFNLGNFVKWSDMALQNNFGICLLGKNPFGSNLELIANKDRKLQNRPVVLKNITSLADSKECAILFLSSSEQSNLTTLFNELKGKPILTVGDSEQFVVSGGMIQFYQREGKIRLMIDPQTLEESGLKASSQLMKIAQRVERKE
jgi:hypothetical protein